MEHRPVETAVTDSPDAPPAQCSHCSSRTLFWWRNPKGRSLTWYCSACRAVHTRTLSDSRITTASTTEETTRSTARPAASSSLSRPASQRSRVIGLRHSLK